MKLISSGILLYHLNTENLKIFLVHPGGPYFKNKDIGSWSIPKGLAEEGANLKQSALRELEEETGIKLLEKSLWMSLGKVKQKGGKAVYAWGVEYQLPKGFKLNSNTFKQEWPPRSGITKWFPEVDKGAFFDFERAKTKIIPEQITFLERLKHRLEKQV